MRVTDLFAGCGSMSLGFENAGFKIVSAFDNWKPAMDVYKANFSHDVINIDLSKVNDYGIFRKYSPDMIIGGPPCQDFSSAGKRNEGLGRANLTISFARVMANVEPKWFVMENVERIKKSETLQKSLKIFKHAGYGLTSKVLNASLCGVPQLRKRYFLIGEFGGKDNALEYYLEKNLSKKPMTVYDYLGDELGIKYYYRHPRSYKRRGVFSIHEPSPTVRGVNRPIPKGYKEHPGDAADISGHVRPLSTIERSYIQTFPKNFIFRGNKSNLEQMIGNAVPVKLAEYVAKCILEYIGGCENHSPKKREPTQLSLF